MNPVRNSVAVKRRGEALGFDAIGVASLERNAHADALDRWLAAGYAGTMSYLHRQAEQRKLPHRIMPEATVAVVTHTTYFRSEEHTSELQSRLHLVCRLLLEKKKKKKYTETTINNETT